MPFKEKYFKYKNKYLDIKNLFGGRLNKDHKKVYFTKLKNLYTVTGKDNDEYYSDILKDLLNILYTNIKEDINEYEEKVTSKEDMLKYDDLMKKYDNLKKTYILPQIHILDIPEFNIRSVQIIILFTELVKLTNKFADTTMINYFQPELQINHIYNEIVKLDWVNYKVLYNKMLEFDTFISLFGDYDIKYNRKKNIHEKILTKLWTFRDIKSSRIVCYLDLISPKEIVFSLANEIYYLGIASQMEWADGLEITPFEFLHHDLTHSNNRGIPDGYKAHLEIEFVKYLDGLKLDKEQSKQINMMLFILMHESMSEDLLTNKILDSTEFSSIYPSFITKIDNWTNNNFYGSLLPIDLLNTRNETKIQEYLDNSFILLKNTWNDFIEKTKIRTALNADPEKNTSNCKTISR